MNSVDIAVVGGGLAGSAAATMLGRGGIDTVLIDPRPEIRPDFRCEKFDASQIAILRSAGLVDIAARHATPCNEIWVARRGRLLDRRPGSQLGFRYHEMVNALRRSALDHAAYRPSKAERITTDGERRVVELANGEAWSARLVVLASGLNMALRHSLAIGSDVLSACHSVSVGFDIAPRAAAPFRFAALTYYPERLSNRMAYLTLFPIGAAMRANLFVYRTMDDPWLSALRADPARTLHALLPRLARLTGEFEVTGDVRVRPVDLTVATCRPNAGVVLAGDAFSTSCPAAGTGAAKVFTDVERLCNAHIPRWLQSPGMGPAKIASFYNDPEKCASETFSRDKAFALRSMSLDPGPVWAVRRSVRFWGGMALGIAHELARPSADANESASDADLASAAPPPRRAG